MQLPSNLNLKPSNILKFLGFAIVSIIIITFAFRLISTSFNSIIPKNGIKNIINQGVSDFNSGDMYAIDDMEYSKSTAEIGLSTRNIAPGRNASMGSDAEEFEITEYSANIESRNMESTCNEIERLKAREDVVFENANKYEKSCNYYFKVKTDSVPEIIEKIKALDPKQFNENTFTIKRLIDDYTSELEILKKKMKSIEETLSNAVKAYDDITELATKTKDVESLAKIINSKISIIERLTQESININAQLERLERSRAEQMDRLNYTFFRIYITENKFIDKENLLDSWKNEIKSFVRDINKIFQDITINLITLLMFIVQYVIYFFIVILIAKYCWLLTKNIWNK